MVIDADNFRIHRVGARSNLCSSQPCVHPYRFVLQYYWPIHASNPTRFRKGREDLVCPIRMDENDHEVPSDV